MDLDFGTTGKVKVGMVKYVRETIAYFPEIITGTATTPAANHIFDVREEAPNMEEERARIFHRTVARLLFLCKRARPDIQTAIAFMTTRVKAPDEDDWKKLIRLLKYLRGTQFMRLMLSANRASLVRSTNRSTAVKWWVDASYAVHPNMRSHTGLVMSLGEGCVQGSSSKQKINTGSSTEAELVAVTDRMPNVLWTNYFLAGQGIGAKATVKQDNKVQYSSKITVTLRV